jgi:probable rRNA maturation factor
MSPDDPGGKPTVLISDRQDLPVDQPELAELAIATLLGEGVGAGELSVSLVDEDEMTSLHVRYMQEPGPTDVLSFPMDGDEHLLGDVVIAPAVAARNNPADPRGELRLLLVHGILHLLGHDHEADDERADMWARQERYSGVRTP